MNRFKDRRKVVSLTLVGVAYLLIVIPLIVSNLQKQTAYKGRASTDVTSQAQVCGIANSNTMAIIDRSGSMGEVDASGNTKISNAILAGDNFVDLTAKNPVNEIGLVSFASTATTDISLTSNFSSVKTKINALKAAGSTCIQCAIDAANAALSAGKRTDTKNVMVLLTDGIANYIEGSTTQASQATAEQAALTAAKNSHAANDTIIFVIGLGKDVNTTFLQQLATSTGGQYYFPPSSQNLNDIYSQISQIIAQGSVSGSVFNDTNGNGKLDTGEQKLSGWTVQITNQATGATQNIVTDTTGSFIIPQLCNGTYTLKEVIQNGWNETVPVNPNSYTITISTGNAITDKVFGNIIAPPTPTPTPRPTATPTPRPTATPIPTTTPKPTATPTPKPTAVPTTKPTATPVPTAKPTATPTPGKTTMNMTVSLDGIGNRGDNTNPTGNTLSNKQPQHRSIGADILVYTTSNNLIASGTGTIAYNETDGNYSGNVPISAGFPSGYYVIKVKTHTHLRRQIEQVQNILAGQVNTITPATLVTGDINNDNSLNILDYNLLLNCYSDLTAAVDCPALINKTDSDLNDDGSVNQVDYNLFLRELSTQPGQ
ncbi:MAG TPA: VWA domain-containing protein [Candidatus Saccharimonadales bacterium]|nr:VWA domain-containing protein [Candidatus Saccharimonadales bacterium]